jgi:hypothetical protein
MAELEQTSEPIANRRVDNRIAPRARVKVECRKSSGGLGQNLATELIDLSQFGAKITSKAELVTGQEVEIILLSAALQKPVKVLANVVRSEELKNGAFRLGIRFQKSVSYGELRLLTNF